MAKREFVVLPGKEEMPFSSAVRAGDFIFVSGTTGNLDATGNLVAGIEDQTKQCLENIGQTLRAARASLSDVVKATVFLTNVDHFAKMNGIYKKYFPKDRPARSTVITGLVRPDMLIEIECVVYKP